MCFFRKGKLTPFQRLVADISDWHVTALRSLTSIEVDMPGVTSFVCSMYGFTTSDINEARYKAFIRMSGGDEKYPLATIKKSNCACLPPCNKTLGNHVIRAQVVSMNLEESQSDGSNWRGKTHRIRMEREQQPPGARQVSRKVCPRNSRSHS